MITRYISAKFIAKAGVVLGTSLFNSKIFSAVSRKPIEKVVMGYAGGIIGAYIGVRVVNNMDKMLTKAFEVIDEEEKDDEVKVNG
ncbi:MAG: hypothetical protein J6U54_08715 [Clostridiales bacterium]|nr:hypothetical protein [Clostridiales bacterium]